MHPLTRRRFLHHATFGVGSVALAYLREPSEKELAGALAFLAAAADAFRNQPAPAAAPPKKGEKAPEPPSAEARALAAFCQALLASNRFLYVD